jgi:hypothetical protein
MSFGSHGIGGEITWRCNGNNEYIFQLKFYRDCNGIPGANSITLQTTVPGVPTIYCPLISQTDISPDGLLANGIGACPTCPQGNAGNPIFGIVEEFVYESAPVSLIGVPPSTGWEFTWGECCRSGNLTNVTSPGAIGFLNKSVMYPYNGQNASQCFDNSPYFIEKPSSIVCTGYPYIYHHLSNDSELDSLSYSFDVLLDEFAGVIPFAPGYSVNNPLADPVTLDPLTGEMSFTGTTGGYFATVVKVSAFKCGVLVAEVRREINVLIENNCPLIMDAGGVSGINLPPQMEAPFQDANGQFTLYADTVSAGDTVYFNFVSTDFQLFNNWSGQIVSSYALGQQFGDSTTSDSSGCLIPPCATLNPGSPYSGPLGIIQDFNWRTVPAHLNYSFSCVQFANTYYFLNKMHDNYCPANASSARIISITVEPAIPRPPVTNNNGTLECNWGPTYIYQWFLNRFAIPGATSSSYTPSQGGTYQVLAVAPDGQGNYSLGYHHSPVGISEATSKINLSVRPNPAADGVFEVQFELLQDADIRMRITDISGRELFAVTETAAAKGLKSMNVNLSEYPAGIYLMELSAGSGNISYTKLISQSTVHSK